MLNQDQISGKWTEIKGGVRNLWGKITDEELEMAKGNIGEIAGIIQNKYGETKEAIKQKLDKLFGSFDNDTDRNHRPDESSFERRPIEEDTQNKNIKDLSFFQDDLTGTDRRIH